MLNKVKTILILRIRLRTSRERAKNKKGPKEDIEKGESGWKRNTDAISKAVSANILQRLP